jgi:O-acetylserine/cysteine efflux transporter
MPAGLAAILLQTQALMTIALAYPILGERASRLQLGAIAVVAAGVLCIAAGAAQNATLLPVVLVIFGALGWAIANIALKLARPPDLLSFTVWSSLTPAIAMLALSAIVEGMPAWTDSWQHLTWLGVLSIAYLAYPISLASGWAWNSLMSRYSAATFAPFALLVPIVAMAGGALIYGERLNPSGIAGSVLVLAGLAILVVAGRVAPKPTVV